MLKSEQADLYKRLQNYQLDDPTHEFGFIHHLIKNHGWTQQYADRAIAEYKKFLFLTVVADHQIVPSDPVDQVWHAHLLTTQSYWEDFCPHILGQTLHHHPARGGDEERTEFHGLYLRTIESYRTFFGMPPIDLWSPPYRRFGIELKEQRVNTMENWIIPKRWPRWKPSFSLHYVAIAVILMGILLVEPSLAVTLTGEKSFFLKTEVLIALALILGVTLRFLICWPRIQVEKRKLTPYQMAYLAGKQERTVELAIARLVDQGYLHPNLTHRSFSVKKALPENTHPIEQEIINKVRQTPELKSLKKFRPRSLQATVDILKQDRLVISGGAALTQQFLKLTFGGLVALIFFSGCMQGSNIRDVNSLYPGYFIGLLLTLPTAFTNFRTHWGNTHLQEIEKTHDTYDISQSIALFGTQAMSGGNLDVLRKIYRQVEKEESESSCGCGCGC